MTQNPCPEINAAYYAAARNVKRTIRSAKYNKEKAVAKEAKHNPKGFYAYINENRIMKAGVGPLINDKEELLTRADEMANLLNNYFTGEFTTEDLNNLPDINNKQYAKPLEDVWFSQTEVEELLTHINIYKPVIRLKFTL